MIYLNGQFLPDEAGLIPVSDRGFLYGDGLFETLLAHQGEVFCWQEHWDRLNSGAVALRIPLPAADAIREAAGRLLRLNQLSDALIRITVSRGVGRRGYSPRGANKPTIVITTHELPPEPKVPWWLVTARTRLHQLDPLAGFKTANKLLQVIARSEADDAGADDALLLNSAGDVAETSSGNVFFHQKGALVTPPLNSGILPGVTRRLVIQIGISLGITVREVVVTSSELEAMDGAFVTLTSFGIVPVGRIDDRTFPTQAMTLELKRHYRDLKHRETR